MAEDAHTLSEVEAQKIDIFDTVLECDESFLPCRPHVRAKQGDTALYLKWRRALLYKQLKDLNLNNSSIDRRIVYMFSRELLLSTKFPTRNMSKAYGYPDNDLSSTTRTATRSEYDLFSDFDERRMVSASDWYSFKGMHHIMAHHTKAVTRIKFYSDDRGILAMGSVDGSLSIVESLAEDIDKTLKMLQGHTLEITDIEFSKNGNYLVSSSFDKTIRVWDTQNGTCLRSFEETSPVTTLIFHPINEHILICGTLKGDIKFISFSSGKEIASCKLDHPATTIAMDLDSASSLFAGDSSGNLHFINVKLYGSDYVLDVKGLAQLSKGPITSIQWRKNHTPKWTLSSLLVSQRDAPIRLISIMKTGSQYEAEEFCQFPRKPTKMPLRSCYSPYAALRNMACITCGSDSGTIYIYAYRPSSNPKKKGRVIPLNQLSGHASPVLDVQWTQDESLLASSDQDGIVILWKRIELSAQNFQYGKMARKQ